MCFIKNNNNNNMPGYYCYETRLELCVKQRVNIEYKDPIVIIFKILLLNIIIKIIIIIVTIIIILVFMSPYKTLVDTFSGVYDTLPRCRTHKAGNP